MRNAWRFSLTASLVALCGGALPARAEEPRASVVIVIGAPGTEEFGQQFEAWGERWRTAAEAAGADVTVIGREETPGDDLQRLEEKLHALAAAPPERLWLVLIGHGTFDGKTARFNLRGPDVSGPQLAGWLKSLSSPMAIVNCTSSSSPFLAELSGHDRVVITATRSGNEYNFARLGDHLSAAITDPAADLDKDDQISLLEAFLLASARVREFYAAEARLATEHALIDDNGDSRGTPADWFQGARAVKSAAAGTAVDGDLARRFILAPSPEERELTPESRQRRDNLEAALAGLRARKPELTEEAYLAELEPLLIKLGRLYTGTAD